MPDMIILEADEKIFIFEEFIFFIHFYSVFFLIEMIVVSPSTIF